MAEPAEATSTLILFDLGKVVVDWDPMRLYRQLFSTESEAKRFCTDICNLTWHTEHDRGVPMAENAQPLIAQYPQYESQICAWRTRWLDMFDGYVDGMPTLIGELQSKGTRIFGLTNLPAEVADETFDAFPLIRTFEDVVVSGAERVVKPDPRIFQIALTRMGNPDPSRVLFVDDREENTDAAAALGFQVHLFQNKDQLSRHLSTARIL